MLAASTLEHSISAIGATATVLAVLVAVFGPALRERRSRPRLRVEFEREDVVQVRPDGKLAWVFARPRVLNRAGRWTAQDVEILLTGVRPCRAGSPELTPELQLIAGRPMKWSDVDERRLSIAPGAYRRFDLVHVSHPGRSPKHLRARLGRGKVPLVVDVVAPTDDRHRLLPGDYEIDLVVTARDIDAVRYRAVVAFDGAWDGTVAQRLDVSLKSVAGPAASAG